MGCAEPTAAGMRRRRAARRRIEHPPWTGATNVGPGARIRNGSTNMPPPMPLSPGTRLAGRYEVLEAIGAGGMGQIFRARDLRLDRAVAVKILPEHLADDEEALSRLEKEAKALAALQHPNILTVHDFGSEDGISYVVTELLEGETLRAR